MIKPVSKIKARSRKIMLRAFMRWFMYTLLLLVFYLWHTNPMIKGFCPLLIIPLATAVAMHEGELAAGIFGVICGLMLDMASGTILGFSSLWLIALCPAVSLLSYYCIRVSWASHFVLNFAVSVIMGLLDFLFLHSVWEGGNASISFYNVILPSYLGAVIGSVPVYLLVSRISVKLRPKERHRPDEAALSQDEERE